MSVVRVDAAVIHRLVASTFVAAGAPDDLAATVAEVLVDNHLAGHDSHGLVRLPQYLDAIDDGSIDPTARPTVLEQTPTTALVSGRWGFGQVAAVHAVDVLVAKAVEQRIATVSLVQANHTGRLAAFTERAARRGIVVLMAIGTVGPPRTAPHGGAAAVLGTNPVAVSLPGGDGPPVTLDYATSAIANGKVMVAHAEGQQLPPGVIADRDGTSTTDPAAVVERGGYLLPFGGHKGYALAVVAELLGVVLTGAGEHDPADPPTSGAWMVGLRQDTFRSAGSYEAAVGAAVQRLVEVPPAPGVDEVLVPGLPEARARAVRTQSGIEVGTVTWARACELAAARGVDVAAVTGSVDGAG